MQLSIGRYVIKFDWQALSVEGGEMDVFLNHIIVGSLKATDDSLQKAVIHV